jgi:hypothetical protein
MKPGIWPSKNIFKEPADEIPRFPQEQIAIALEQGQSIRSIAV